MEVELEAKFVGVDSTALRQSLVAGGARLVHAERLMRRLNFDFPNHSLEYVGGWVRLRDEGDQVTLAYKQVNDRTLHGTKEVSVVVDNFERALALLEAIGCQKKAVQETKRERWQLGDCEVTIDTWPWIPPFVEFEGPSEQVVRQAATALGFDLARALHGSVEIAYQQYYDVTEAEIYNCPAVVFGPVPVWLEAKRRKK